MHNPYQAPGHGGAAPTNIRQQVLLLATAASFMLYVDRYCLGDLLKYKMVRDELGLNNYQYGLALGAFFWPYAVCQVPAGWLADRFGPRHLLAIYVIGWSLFAAATGLAGGFVSLFLMRLGLGVMQAGAYPASGNLVSRWVPLADRGRASALISLGGRLGAAAAMISTSALVAWSWRATMIIYGAIGCGVGVVFHLIARDRPEQHPQINAVELELIAGGRDATADASPPPHVRQVLRQVLSSGSMWAMCVAQFTTNIGWVFLVLWLPPYLIEERHFSTQWGANMNAITLFAGMFGLLLGGRLTDLISRHWGLRHGRALPVALSRFLAAGGCLAVPYIESPTGCIIAFCVVSIGTDLGIPAMWAYMQDVGGRNVAAVLGWGNMAGNFGGAIAPVLILGTCQVGETIDWNKALFVCGSAFILSGIASFFIDATKPLAEAG